MKLLEHKGKELLKLAGIRIPQGIVVDNKSYINLSYHKERYKEFFHEHKHVIIKAQVIGGKRKKQGLIVDADEYRASLDDIAALYDTTYNNAPITTLLIEKALQVKEEYFLAIVYDSVSRKPMLLFSTHGGIDIEEQSQHVVKTIINPLYGIQDFQIRSLVKQAGFTGSDVLAVSGIIRKAYTCFEKYDCRSLEINPLIRTPDNLFYAGDAKITIDDAAIARHDIFADVTDVEDRSYLSERELAARKIDYYDHRGVAGKTFVDLDGNIAVLASGGGASLTAMDAIIQAGGHPANYTEYSGNPSREKVRRLAEITLAKEGLSGCLIIGGKANFTDIYETLAGIMDVLERIKPSYPIVIRRAGNRDKEAFAMIRKKAASLHLDVSLFGEETPMSKAAHIMVEKVQQYMAQQEGV